MRRIAFLAAIAALAAGCGGATTATTVGHAAARTVVTAGDRRFLRTILTRERADEQLAMLAARKGSTAQVRAGAARRVTGAELVVADATRALRLAKQAVPPQPLTNPDGFATLVDVAGSSFDAAYAPLQRARDAVDRALARGELRHGRFAPAKAVARQVR